ncbi:RsmB/NOP family class I SAM-dependent RNA methyltransferase [Roseovarius spongiae]|uniref:RsmB/NOP family class I SAM-dependent RNA methyltransferase n=1 Tax=Roseovarius spongiae TaxID=2320272 RepID=A0A3A8BBS1_9RHOB|nr:RsmB/NOP family class I SAM-dependent RNA methyltransferase [Roseovarius spongiae]RKF16954.1 RsmB/NOP family class I SAM-dependent RNA methyltransferase [Roseovarius spongiae]
MTPAAQVQAAIEILDRIDGGMATEKALTGWARGARYAGSRDRAAVRDHVFQARRCWRSYACLGGAETGRGRMIGALRASGIDPATLFTGEGYAPAPLDADEREAGAPPRVDGDRLNLPDWLVGAFRASLGDAAEEAAQLLCARAPATLRVNRRKGDIGAAQEMLARDGVRAVPLDGVRFGLQVTDNERRIASSSSYLNGLVELQDASSQAAMETIPLEPGQRILDYCAGGGGKALALAAREDVEVFAHDANPDRMRDLPVRAARADAPITLLATERLAETGPFDIVLCDVPCSGSGAWRRSPDGKWLLENKDLEAVVHVQREILTEAAALVAPGGRLVYATCSVLQSENEEQAAWFAHHGEGWSPLLERRWPISRTGDGFYVAHFRRDC